MEFVCEWADCSERFATGAELVSHLSGEGGGHLGKKANGNLVLQCLWQDCPKAGTTYVKRDHLRSHLATHLLIKPHVCDICTKSFKRPQDLKKHSRIHTETHQQAHKNSKAITVVDGRVVKKATPVKKSPSPPAPTPKRESPEADREEAPYTFYPTPLPPHVYNAQSYGQNYPPNDLASVVAQQQQLNHAAFYPLYPTLPPFQSSLPQYYDQAYSNYVAPSANYPSPHSLYGSPPSALYPSLPMSTSNLYPSIYRTLDGSPSVAGSQSPGVAISPPPGSHESFSGSPEQSSEVSERRSISGNTVAGAKRGFDEAAGGFMDDLLKNKRIQDFDAIGQQLDELSTFLLNPMDPAAPGLTPSTSHEGSSVGSDFSREEVDSLNELLLSLGQTMESSPAYHNLPPLDSSIGQHHLASDSTQYQTSGFTSIYPAFPSIDRQYASMKQDHMHGYDEASLSAHSRIGRINAPATIQPMDIRIPTYRKIDRLMRAAPIFCREPESMEVDEETVDERYSSIRSTTTPSTPATLAGHPVMSYSQKLPLPIRTLSGPTLPPISTVLGSAAGSTTLPHIRDLISDAETTPRSNSMSSVSSTESAEWSPVEQIAHGVHILKVRGSMSEASSIEDGAEEIGDVESEPKLKKLRLHSSTLDADSVVASAGANTTVEGRLARRQLVLRALVVRLNSNFRKQTVAQRV